MNAPELATPLNRVDARKLMKHVEAVTRFVRSPDSDGEREAFEYIRRTLAAFDLKPERHTLPAYVSLPVRAELTLAGEAVPCTTHSMLPSADLKAELVYIPDARDIPGSGTAGKIIMTDGLAMAPVMFAAQAEGAAGMVFIAGARDRHEMIVSRVWGNPEPKDLDAYLCIPAVTVNYAGGKWIGELLAHDTVCRMKTEVKTWWTKLPVLTADLGDTSKAFMLLTAHVDSWHQGALDNASGNAAVLEIARILSEYRGSLRRGIRLVFWSGHSHGRYAGSTAYCDEFFQELHDKAFLHVNADCLGGCGASLLSQAGCMAETWSLGDYAVRTVTGESLEGTRFGRSCDQAFWGTGTPSLFSSVSEQPKPETADAASKAFSAMFGGSKGGGYGWWWHTVSDTPDKLDPELLQRDARIFLAATLKACTDTVIPLDIRAGFAEFAGHARRYAQMAGPCLDFAPLLDDVSWVESLLARQDLVILPEDAANRLILDFERKLVPLLNVKGSIYGHDPAVSQGPLPLLENVADYARERSAHKKNAWAVYLKRRLNECRNRVRELAAVLEEHNRS